MGGMTLRDYQLDLANKVHDIIKNNGLAYLAAQVRCGKTGVALKVCEMLGKKDVLFVTKKGAISSIQNDYKGFGFTYNLTVINFESVNKCAGVYDFIIIDEAHSIGAFPKPTKRHTDLKQYCIAKQVLFLSGTPNPESYSQLFHQFNVTTYSPWAHVVNFYKWCREGYVTVTKKRLGHIEINDYSNAHKDKVLGDVDHLIVRFSQDDAGFTKKVLERVEYVTMGEDVHGIAKTLKRDKVVELGASGTVLADTAVKMQGKLHQLYSGILKIEDGKYLVIDDSKCQYIRENYRGKKIAIFYKFIAEWHMIQRCFESITQDPFEFNATGTDTIFARQYVSGREGINLSEADYLIFLNLDFSAISYMQSKERMMTKDRTKEAIAVYIFAVGGIEEKIYKVLQGKRSYTMSYFLKDYGFKKGEFKPDYATARE